MTPQSDLKLPFTSKVDATPKQIIKAFLLIMLYGMLFVAVLAFIARIYYTIWSFIWNLPIWDLFRI